MALTGWRAVQLGWTLGLAVGCAALKPPAQGKLTQDAFDPGRPSVAAFGVDPTARCHAAGLIQLLLNETSEVRPAGSAAVVADGQLCAAAESLLGWTSSEPPSAQVAEFLAWHVGLPSPPRLRAFTNVISSEEPAELAVPVMEALKPFAQKAARPHFGVATQRLAKGSTRVVLLLQEPAAEFASVPRRLAPGASMELRGRMLDPVKDGEVLVSDVQGQVERSPLGADQAFAARLKCAEKAGQIQFEVRGEQDGAKKPLLAFTVLCGAEVPQVLSLREVSDWPKDPLEQGKKALELVNKERTAAGLGALGWDDAVASVARAVAEELRDTVGKGATTSPDPRPLLAKADAMSPVVLENPGQAPTTPFALQQFSKSPALRANQLSAEITHAGIGVAPAADGKSVFVVELFVRQLVALDLASTQKELLKRLNEKRVATKAPPFATDPALDAAAGRYAAALAQGRGELSNAAGNEFLAPHRKAYKTLNVLSGVKVDPLSFADEQSVVTDKAGVIGVGMASGIQASFGKNSVYVVILLGTKR